MSEHTIEKTNPKTRGQDLLGLALAGLGAFSAVSLFQALQGKQAENPLARPVEGLMSLAGPWAGLFLSVGVTVLGVLLFLGSEARPVGRQLLGVVGAGVGLALVLGGLVGGSGGAVGGILPAALGSTAGLVGGLLIGITICLTSVWVTWARSSTQLGAKPSPNTGLMARTHAIDGVSSAEAQALQATTSPEGERAGGVFADLGHEGLPPEVRPLSPDEAIRSQTRRDQRQAAGGIAHSVAPALPPQQSPRADLAAPRRGVELPARGFRGDSGQRAEAPRIETSPLRGLAEPGIPESSVPAPTWESSAPVVGADEGWEQVGLFDEEGASAGLDEAGDGLADVLEAEPGENGFEDGFDTGSEEYEELEYEAEEGYGLAGAMKLAEEGVEELEEEELAAEAEYLIAPPPQEVVEAAEPEPEEGDPTIATPPAEENLLYDAGRLFLDENRVAVSMLQRRFELDFENACELLDRLQEEGLIGPYVGGRTREILLTREEWDAKAASLA